MKSHNSLIKVKTTIFKKNNEKQLRGNQKTTRQQKQKNVANNNKIQKQTENKSTSKFNNNI